ncbi:MAG: hypothetical protein Q9187_003675 [Circinaria calcarea]
MSKLDDDSSANLRSLLAGLTPGGSRTTPANNFPGARDSSDFSGTSTQTRASENSHPQNQSTSFPTGFSSFQAPQSPAMNPQAATSKTGTPGLTTDQSGSDRTAHLLNLLKFKAPPPSNQGSATQPQSPASNARPGYGVLQGKPNSSAYNLHGRGISASDLVASLSPKPGNTPPRTVPTPGSGVTSTANPQDFLLQLLRPRPAQSLTSSGLTIGDDSQGSNQATPQAAIDTLSKNLECTSLGNASVHPPSSIEGDRSARKDSPIRIFGSNDSKEPTPFEPQDMPKVEPAKESIFTYVNPFDQLAASSPRNAKSRSGNNTPSKEGRTLSKLAGQGINGDGHKRKIKEPSQMPSHSSSRRKLTPSGQEVMQSIESTEPDILPNGRSQLDALMGIGAPTTDTETVAEALNQVGDQVSRQVENALAQAEADQDEIKVKDEDVEEYREAELELVEEQLHEAAVEVKEELDKDGNEGLLESTMPKSVAKAVKDIIDDAAEGAGIENQKGERIAETRAKNQEADSFVNVIVYNFPLKPFVSIDIKPDAISPLNFREDAVMDIARLKKEFDQIDRTLATASNEFILYAMPKPGGLRIIRQEDGLDRQIFRDTHDRIFNASISTAPPGSEWPSHETQTLVATAVSGSVYWATICQPSGDSLKDETLEQHGLAFPPVPAHDENTSGGQLKTRAKKSSRHPEFFAIGRGKSIQIVFPLHAKASSLVSSTFVVDTEKYFKDRCLKINTGKAGKDFTFSEDDTMIVTLDKAGRVRFWDITDLIDQANGTASKIAPIEIKTPILTFSTAVPNEKPWPTSLLFVDKLRPYTKGIALRYVIVGMKQNHTLQLWDLGLGKAVQELNFPHEKESDAICSVSYHPASGIIVVGHPTRNSIYFIHLSAPKYSLPAMSQSKFVQRLANKDPSLPKPESTAIMSGIREYSFLSKGQLRSLDLLPISNESTRGGSNMEDPALFELYAMHSKGVTCLSIKKEDLGWSQDSKVLYPVEAEKVGCIVVKELREPHSGSFGETQSANEDTTQELSGSTTVSSKSTTKESKKQTITQATKPADSKSKDHESAADVPKPAEAAQTNGTSNATVEKSEKKKKKRAGGGTGDSSSVVTPFTPAVSESYATAAQRARSPAKQTGVTSDGEAVRPVMVKSGSLDAPEAVTASTDTKAKRSALDAQSISVGISGDFIDKELKKIEKSVSGVFSKVLGQELDTLHRRLDEDKRVQDAAGAAKQDAVLRLVSLSLTENVDKALSRHISTSIQQVVLPSIANITSSTLDKKISEILAEQLRDKIPSQLKSTLSDAISKAVQDPDVLRAISDQVTSRVTSHVEKDFSTVLHNTITPTFQKGVINTAQKLNAETERRVGEQIHQAELQHRNDSTKIDQLTALVRGLSETVHTMAAAQSEFQSEILKLQQQSWQDRQGSSTRNASAQHQQKSLAPSESPEPAASPEQEELDRITSLMKEGRFEEGTIQWLQSNQQADLFDEFFIKCNPAYLKQCQALVTLSVGAAVTASLETNISERLEWLETVISTIDPRDPDIREVAPKIMDVLCQRLEGQFMRIAENDPRDPILRLIPPLTRRAREISSLSR